MLSIFIPEGGVGRENYLNETFLSQGLDGNIMTLLRPIHKAEFAEPVSVLHTHARTHTQRIKKENSFITTFFFFFFSSK